MPVAQPDGGRDALRYVTNVADPRFTVYQVKYSRNPRDGGNARKWVLETLDGEVEKIKRVIDKGANQYVFITNIPGTSHLDIGSIEARDAG
jgi:hypothetical protein